MQHIMFTDLLTPNDPDTNAAKLACFASKNSLQLKFSRGVRLWSVGRFEYRTQFRR
jgi:hypothetical protein